MTPKILPLKPPKGYDATILLMVLTLVCFGVVMVYSASSIMAAKRYSDSLFFLKRQLAFAGVGGCALYVGMCVDYQFWKKCAVPALFCCIILLALVLVPGIGSHAGGASRWFRVGPFSLQPSEFAKVALVLYMSYSLARKQEKVRSLGHGFIPYMIVLMFLLFLLMLQPDLGSALTLAGVAMLMLLAAGTRPVYLFSVFLMSLPFLYFAIFNVEYRRRRILAFLDPWGDPRNTGFQIIQSWYAFANGGLAGKGLGQGQQKLFYLPEAHTDFIVSVIAEELGFVAVALLCLFFLLLVFRSVRTALQVEDDFGRFLAFGVALLFGLQAALNVAVATGTAPTKGLALPFISYGGSSLVLNMFAAGLLLNVSAHVRTGRRGWW